MFYAINNQKGFAAYLAVILILSTAIGIIVSITLLVAWEHRISSNFVKSSQAYYASEAGIEDAIYRLKKFMSVFADYTINVEGASVNVLTNSASQNNWTIISNGKMNNVFRKLEVYLTVSAEKFDFFYGAQAGELGIEMENNSRVEGAGGAVGNIYSNGSIDGDPGATITGDAFVATGMSEDQTHILYNDDQIFGQANPVIDIAQSFKPSVSNTLTKASIYIKKVGKPGDRTIRILTDSFGSPSKTTLATATLQSSLVGTSYGWVDVVFPLPPNLIQGNTYWLMIDAVEDSKDYWSWGKDKNQGYGNGQGKYVQDWNTSNPSWDAIVCDLNFKTYMGGIQTFLQDVTVFGDAHANTITNSNICGDGYYQTIDTGSLNFLNNPTNPTCLDPLTPGTAFPGSTDPPLENMPISDSNINQWKQDAINGGMVSGDLIIDSDMSYGPKKIEGNLIMTSNNKNLTITGTLYITGYIDISNGSAIRCSPDYGLNSCILIADQWIHIANNGVFQGSGQPGSYILILTTSPCDGVSAGICTDYNAAIDIHNNATGAIFYAHNGLAYVHNGVVVSELTAKKLQLEQNAIVRYEQGLINSKFTSGPGAGWKVVSWKEIE